MTHTESANIISVKKSKFASKISLRKFTAIRYLDVYMYIQVYIILFIQTTVYTVHVSRVQKGTHLDWGYTDLAGAGTYTSASCGLPGQNLTQQDGGLPVAETGGGRGGEGREGRGEEGREGREGRGGGRNRGKGSPSNTVYMYMMYIHVAVSTTGGAAITLMSAVHWRVPGCCQSTGHPDEGCLHSVEGDSTCIHDMYMYIHGQVQNIPYIPEHVLYIVHLYMYAHVQCTVHVH